jgi:hypothetical protein
MKSVAIGVHLRREDVEPLAEAVPVGDLFISAVAVQDDQPLGDRDLLLRIADVRKRLLDRATFIAIRYGFAFSTAGEAAAKCLTFVPEWKKTLQENRGRVELTLKVAASGGSPRPERRTFGRGADYLRALHASTRAAKVDERFQKEVEARLVPLCARWRWTARDSASVEFAGLVDRDRLDDLLRAGDAIKSAAPHVPFLLSAPWPLEVFADADHE